MMTQLKNYCRVESILESKCKLCNNIYKIKEVIKIEGEQWWVGCFCSTKCRDEYLVLEKELVDREEQRKKQIEKNRKFRQNKLDCIKQQFLNIGVTEETWKLCYKKAFKFSMHKDFFFVTRQLASMYEILKEQLK